MREDLMCECGLPPYSLSAKGRWGAGRNLEVAQGNLGVMDMFIILLVVIFSWIFTNVKTCEVIHFKYV